MSMADHCSSIYIPSGWCSPHPCSLITPPFALQKQTQMCIQICCNSEFWCMFLSFQHLHYHPQAQLQQFSNIACVTRIILSTIMLSNLGFLIPADIIVRVCAAMYFSYICMSPLRCVVLQCIGCTLLALFPVWLFIVVTGYVKIYTCFSTIMFPDLSNSWVEKTSGQVENQRLFIGGFKSDLKLFSTETRNNRD